MRITCSKDHDGCGETFELTSKLLELFEWARSQKIGTSCPNTDCSKYYTVEHVEKVLNAVSRTKKVPPTKSLKAIGAEGILTTADLVDLSAAKLRVAKLMADGKWYTSDQIKEAAGKGNVQASEGLRRMRELRDITGVDVERRRLPKTRLWDYRLVRT